MHTPCAGIRGLRNVPARLCLAIEAITRAHRGDLIRASTYDLRQEIQ